MTFDGGERRGRMHDVIVANGRWHGGGMKLAPDARARRRALRRRPDRRRHEARLRHDLAEALQRRARRGTRGSRWCAAPRVTVDARRAAAARARRRAGAARRRRASRSCPGALRVRVARRERRSGVGSSSSASPRRGFAAFGFGVPVARLRRAVAPGARLRRLRLSSASSRFSIAVEPLLDRLEAVHELLARSLSCIAPWSAVRVAGLCASFSSAPSPTDWSCEITVFLAI